MVVDLKIYYKMSSVSLFTFDIVELCVVTLNDKPWTRAEEACKALRYNKLLILKKHSMVKLTTLKTIK